jgi:hypothetical protein
MINGLFKYFPTDADKLEKFTNGQVYLTPPEHFNDPWDFRMRFEPWTDAQLREQCPSSSSYGPEVFREFKAAMTSANFHADESCNYQKEIGKIVGVVSLAEQPLNPLMWAHYAESHKGFVAEFWHGEEEPFEDDFYLRTGPFGPAAKVHYLKHREQQPECKRDLSNIAKVLWTKHSEWEYEREWRVFQWHRAATPGQTKDGEPRSLLKFEPNQLIRVIFGLRICPTVEAELSKMLRRPEFRHVRKEKADIDLVATRQLIACELSR